MRFRIAILWISFTMLATATEDAFFGRWDLTVQSANEAIGGWLELSRSAAGPQLRIVPRVGGVKLVPAFEMRDGRLVFSNEEWWGHWEHIRYELTIAEGKLSGTARRQSGEAMRVSGVPAPALARNPGAWVHPVALLGGPDLSGWKVVSATKPGNWSLNEGTLFNSRSGPNLRTAGEFQDFRLDLEFNCPRGSNSGIFLRGRYEIQIEEEPDNVEPAGRTGAVYQFLAPKIAVPRRPGEWRKMSITLVGRTVSIVLDGITIIDRQEIPGPTSGGFNSREAEPGPIILQGDHGSISFRNLVLTRAIEGDTK